MRKLLQLLGRQEYLRFDIRDRIIRHFHDPDTARPESFSGKLFGLKYPGRFDSVLDWYVFYFGAYAKRELELLRDILKARENPVFLDVGANVGQHSVFLSAHCDRVIAFEPFEPVRQQIHKKIRLNELTNITVCDVGLGNEDECLDYFPPGTHNRATGSFMGTLGCNEADAIPLRVVAGDEYLRGLELPRVDLVKIDVEGFEMRALQGLRETLLKERPAVFMEYSVHTKDDMSGAGVDLKSLFPEAYSLFAFQGYQVVARYFQKPGYTLEPIPEDGEAPVGNLLAWPQERDAAWPARALSSTGLPI